jgi:formylmethanofuran dehydrogenase subunit E
MKPAAKAPAKAPAPSPTGAVCEVCGNPVSAAEEKTSRLFVSRTLCKKCIQSL